MKKITLLIIITFLLTAFFPVQAQTPAGGVAVIGDSLSHEYRCVPRGNSTSFNWVEILKAKRAVNFGAGATCYAYDFAWSGNTITYQMANMVTWSLEEFDAGNVGRVMILLGYNDISNGASVSTLISTYGAQLDRLLAKFEPQNILVIDLPQEDCAANNSNISNFNAQLATLASNKGVQFASFSTFCSVLNSYAVNSSTYNYGGQSVSRYSWCHINCLRLPNDGHPGTIWHGILANLAASFLGIAPLNEAEVLSMMGVGSSPTNTPSNTPTVTPTRTPTPTPTITNTPLPTFTPTPILFTCPLNTHWVALDARTVQCVND
jgi:hypothetical protein